MPEAVKAPPAGMLARATWSEPHHEDGAVKVQVGFPPAMRLAGISSHLWLDNGGRLTRIVQEMVAAPPSLPTELVLTDEVRAAVDGAPDNGTPEVVADVDRDGAPHASLRGSAQAVSDTQLAMWIRDPAGGLLVAIENSPRLALMCRDPAKGVTYQFPGRARVDDDPDVVATVYANTPSLERDMDAIRREVAGVVDLDLAEGMGPGGQVRMERA